MDVLTKDQRHKNMKAIKAKGTKIELLLAKKLWSNGIRYRKNVNKIFGKPDFAFIRLKIAVFCDSEFWHGKDWNDEQIKTNSDFWQKKIKRNISRDAEVNDFLRKQGWIVLRFWGNEIIKNTDHCIEIITETIKERKNAKLIHSNNKSL